MYRHNVYPFVPDCDIFQENQYNENTAQRSMIIPVYKQKWVFCDIETTSLNPRDRPFGILEIACVVLDDDYNVTDSLHLIVNQPEFVLEAASQWCQTKFSSENGNGLFDLSRASQISQKQAGTELKTFFERHSIRAAGIFHRLLLAGNSVNFDRDVLLTTYPFLHRYIHHKLIDTTTILETVRKLKPDALVFLQNPQSQHRAMVDIHESIEIMRWYSRILWTS